MVTNHGTIKFRWKSPTQITKVADTNHLDMSRCLRQTPWQVRDKPICVSLMEFSPLQCTGKVDDKVRDKVCKLCRGHKSLKSATWFVSWTFMICVRDKSVTLSWPCPGLCRKVGVMEFGLKTCLQDHLLAQYSMLGKILLKVPYSSHPFNEAN